MTAASRVLASPRPTASRVGRSAVRAVLSRSAVGGVLVGLESGFGVLWLVPWLRTGGSEAEV
ncbi:MAG TPA: hypothetical protein VEY67_02845 [Candidatus Dormibacteraeota bacterium]|nr:hypothetical protein [Candidatus Dormibacteraeota bacterium]